VTWRVRVRPEAELDLERAASWYEARRAGLGAEFADEIARLFLSLADGPYHFAEYEAGLRRAFPRRFPYGVYFTVNGDDVIVTSNLHMSRQRGLTS
jgi:plasmid stabilization system protein ParE